MFEALLTGMMAQESQDEEQKLRALQLLQEVLEARQLKVTPNSSPI